MKSIFIKSNLIILSILLSSCAQQNKQGLGTGVGLVAGGLIGSQFGGNKTFGVLLGSGLGALLGGAIGQKMDEKDKKLMLETTSRSLEMAPTGSTIAWQNPDNGHSGRITPTRTYKELGRNCREYTQAIEIDGEFQRAYGKACRNSSGTWEIVSD